MRPKLIRCGARSLPLETGQSLERAEEIGPEGAHDPTADHVQAPKEQSDRRHQVEKNDASHRLASLTLAPVPKTAAPVRSFSDECIRIFQ
jgi:hypothetical protein